MIDEALEALGRRFQVLHQFEQPPLEFAAGAAFDLLPGARDRLLEPIAVERLEQIVERVNVEGAQRVRVVGGDEDHERHARRADGLDDVEPAVARHLHVEEDEIGLQFLDRGNRRHAIGALRDDVHAGFAGEQRSQPLARERLVIRDENTSAWRCVSHATRDAASSLPDGTR